MSTSTPTPTSTVAASHLVKTFGSLRAVDDLSFTVERGEIFGLLGPNGAGKTTTIRLILDLYKPDSGEIAVLGGPMDEAKKDRIGYMPEERGLYRDIPLERCLVYLGTLKGLATSEARRRVLGWLERFDLLDHRRKKVKDLSKGMQQKAQLVATLMHEPELVIVDEPFSGLDPVNTQMVKDILRDLARAGRTIIMSTHQMQQVAELCDRILLVHHGRAVLYGRLDEIRRRYSGHAVRVRAHGDLAPVPGVRHVEAANGLATLFLEPDATPQAVLRHLAAQGVGLEFFEIAMPSLEDIFIEVVQGAGEKVERMADEDRDGA